MTQSHLKTQTRKQLASLAKSRNVVGWHAMRKDELIEALVRHERRRRRKSPAANGRGAALPELARGSLTRAVLRRLSAGNSNGDRSAPADRLSAEATDPWWIHCRWSLSPRSLERAEAALSAEWHQAVPVIRVYEQIDGEATPSSKQWVRDVEIHGAVDHWYVPVENPPRTYRLAIGYRTHSGKFFALVRSRAVRMPRPGDSLGRPARPQESTRGAEGAPGTDSALFVKERLRSRAARAVEDGEAAGHPFGVVLETELVVRGQTHPDAALTCLGEPVAVGADGTFCLRFALPEGRQVIPTIAITPDGEQQRTVVLAIERNTKQLAPQNRGEL
ncbi:MAG: DUF4912 domain-containing protein [Planctomycetes bacterium]|nr:DUF4912 domain-containing protein [Planctomycetota bacterium]